MNDMASVAKGAIEAFSTQDPAAMEAIRDVFADMEIPEEALESLDENEWQLFQLGFGCGAAYWRNIN